jgi:hypothetical protein
VIGTAARYVRDDMVERQASTIGGFLARARSILLTHEMQLRHRTISPRPCCVICWRLVPRTCHLWGHLTKDQPPVKMNYSPSFTGFA